jgi:hypothetical protein
MRWTAMSPEQVASARHGNGPRSCAARHHVAAAALALALVMADAATAGATPDPAQLTTMKDAVARAPVLLVRGDFGLRELRHARLDSTGVSAPPEPARPARPALFATADVPRPVAPATIAWSEITSLETQRPRKLRGALAGLVVGLATGITLALTHEARHSDDYTGLALLTGPPTGGLLLGAFLGSLTGTHVIYRAPTQESN